jgi:probable HAF family extracellular repeat protein
MRRIAHLVAVVALAAGLAAGSTSAGTSRQHWTITDLGTLGAQYEDCVAAAVNDQGQVVGGCGDSRGRQHAFLWQRGRLTYLGTLGGHDSGASLINTSGQIAGTSLTARPARLHAFLWRGGKMTDLGTLGGHSSRPRASEPTAPFTPTCGRPGR